MKTVLSIAGSDSSGGAGMQADLKTMTMHGVYAMSAITALTAQNTVGVSGIWEVSPDCLRQQLVAVFEDIRPDAVKIGMVASSALLAVIVDVLSDYRAERIVIDPVMVASSGARLLAPEAVSVLTDTLFPLATLVTPNIPEAELLSGLQIQGADDMRQAARRVGERFGCAVLLKGGHAKVHANDLLYAGGSEHWFAGERIFNPDTHGTGCTLSSAIAANLAKGFPLVESIARAKAYLSDALRAGLHLGAGCGPLDHAFAYTGRYARSPVVPHTSEPERTQTLYKERNTE